MRKLSFRPGSACYPFAAKPEKVIEILSRTIDFQIPPPPGGWRIFDGTPRQILTNRAKAARQHRQKPKADHASAG